MIRMIVHLGSALLMLTVPNSHCFADETPLETKYNEAVRFISFAIEQEDLKRLLESEPLDRWLPLSEQSPEPSLRPVPLSAICNTTPIPDYITDDRIVELSYVVECLEPTGIRVQPFTPTFTSDDYIFNYSRYVGDAHIHCMFVLSHGNDRSYLYSYCKKEYTESQTGNIPQAEEIRNDPISFSGDVYFLEYPYSYAIIIPNRKYDLDLFHFGHYAHIPLKETFPPHHLFYMKFHVSKESLKDKVEYFLQISEQIKLSQSEGIRSVDVSGSGELTIVSIDLAMEIAIEAKNSIIENYFYMQQLSQGDGAPMGDTDIPF